MATSVRASTKIIQGSGLRQIHLLLAVQSVVIVLLSINRLSTITTGYVAANEFLRWVDFHNMLTLPLISITAFYFLKRQVEKNAPAAAGSRAAVVLGLVFLVGVYLLGASYGDHEVTNYLHVRFCTAEADSPLCRIVIFNDDAFSHWVFFTGFVLVNAALLLLQAVYPHPTRPAAGDLALLILNGLFIGAGIFANLAFEVIGLDLYVVALLALLGAGLLWRRGAQPLFVYYTTAYVLGLAASFLYKALGA